MSTNTITTTQTQENHILGFKSTSDGPLKENIYTISRTNIDVNRIAAAQYTIFVTTDKEKAIKEFKNYIYNHQKVRGWICKYELLCWNAEKTSLVYQEYCDTPDNKELEINFN